VPTERLELSRLSPPPPQDGVSTNSTTSAFPLPAGPRLRRPRRQQSGVEPGYFGISFTFESASAAGFSGTGTGAVDGVAGAELAGGVAINPLCSPRCDENQVRPRLVKKKIVASTEVQRLRKFAEPLEPNTLPALPPPNAAPMSAPLPCCKSTRPMIPSAETTCMTTTKISMPIPFFRRARPRPGKSP
jgi:hypothetical protein